MMKIPQQYSFIFRITITHVNNSRYNTYVITVKCFLTVRDRNLPYDEIGIEQKHVFL